MAADPAEIEAPLVFQCKGCRSILGDSLAFLTSDEASRTITLHGVTQAVAADQELCTSKDGRDAGSSFVRFRCQACGAALGRVYKATSRELDELRDRYTFDIDGITSYQLGTLAAGGRVVAMEEMLAIPSLRRLEQDIVKIQQLMMTMHDRLEELEQQLAAARTAPPSVSPVPSLGSAGGGASGSKRARPAAA